VASGEQAENVFQSLADVLEIGGTLGKRQGSLFLVGLAFDAELLAGAGNGEAFLVKQFLDAQNTLDIFVAVHALTGAAFDWFEVGELGLPEAQDVGGQSAEVRDFPDTEVEFFWNDDVRGSEMGAGGFVTRTQRGSRGGRHRVKVCLIF
jgi:hypothetical protein